MSTQHPVPTVSAPVAVGPVTGPVDATAAARDAGAPEASPPSEWIARFDLADAGPAPSGANWGRCALHFTPRGQPALGVMRLGLMCGPSNGMRRMPADQLRRDGGAGRVELGFRANAGECFRLLVVGGRGSGRLEARLLDAEGKPVARQSGRRRWTMLALDGPVCLDSSGRYRAVVHAERGPLAVQLWRLE